MSQRERNVIPLIKLHWLPIATRIKALIFQGLYLVLFHASGMTCLSQHEQLRL